MLHCGCRCGSASRARRRDVVSRRDNHAVQAARYTSRHEEGRRSAVRRPTASHRRRLRLEAVLPLASPFPLP
ncbi:hypothetical protein MTO96_019804 [Rhipicephalus appendiculatus]